MAALDEVAEFCFDLGELAAACADVGELVLEQGGHVAARQLSVVAEIDDAGDLDQGEAGGLGGADATLVMVAAG